jgi:hypothetical protein
MLSRVIGRAIPLMFAAVLMIQITAAAQVSSSTGAVRGVVTDPNGAVIPGAKVVLTNANISFNRETTTGSDGSFEFALIQPASGYHIEITAPGFEREALSDLTVQVTETTNANAQLKIGGVSQEVVVTGDTEPIQTTSATLGGVISSHVVSELPLPTRNIFDLMATDAGVAATLTSPSATILQGAQALMVAGSRATSNNYTLNGVDANNFEFHTLANGIVPVPNPDAVQEFRTQTSLYDATTGFSSGGNISVVVKSGTKNLHGNVYEYNRDSFLNANDFFFNADGAPRPYLEHNQFGGSLGGPLPGKTFWFANFEGIRERNGIAGAVTGNLPVLPTVRTAANLAQIFGVPASAVDPVAVKILNAPGPYNGLLFPSGVGAPIGQIGTYAFSSPAQYSANQLNTRVDHDMILFGHDNHIYGSVLYSNADFVNPNGGSAGTLGQPYQYLFNNSSFALNDTQLFSPTLINEMTFGFTFNKRDISGLPGAVTSADVGMSRFNSSIFPPLSSFFFTDQNSCCGYAVSADERQHNASFDYRDMVSYVRGKHNFRMGFETRAYQFNFTSPTDRGTLVFTNAFADALYGPPPPGIADSSFRDFLIGAPIESAISSGLTTFGFRARDYVGFFQDDYHVTRRLTLNLGIRYDYLGNVSEVHNEISNFDPSLVSPEAREFGGAGLRAGFISPAGLPVYGTPGVTASTIDPHGKTPFAPRASFAYDVLGNGKLAVRGGYGVYFSRSAAGGPLQTISNPPFDIGVVNFGSLGTKILSNPFPTLPLPSAFPTFPTFPVLTGIVDDVPQFSSTQLSASTIQRNLRTPYIQEWNFTIQYEFLPKWTVELGYIGNHGLFLAATQLTNNALLVNANNPGPFGLTTNDASNRDARAPIPAFGADGIFEITDSGKSFYDALLLTVSHQFGHGLFFKAAYTWSKNLDNYPASTGFDINGNAAGNQFIEDLNKGPAAQDIPQRLVITYVYDLPSPKEGRILKAALGGWTFSGIATLQSGFPGTIFQNTDGNTLSGNDGYGVLIPGCQLVNSGSVTSKLNDYLNPACVTSTPLLSGGTKFGPLSKYEGPGNQFYTITPGGVGQLQGTSTRGAFFAPFQKRWDVGLSKRFFVSALGEGGNIEFKAQAFKITNTPIFNGPTDTTVGDAAFGRITSTIDNSGRQLQFAIKLNF